MFPDIDSEQGGFSIQERRILIRRRNDRKFAILLHKPGPTASEALECRIGELLFECLKRAKVLFDGIGEFSCRLTTAIGRHHKPKLAVIEVSPDIVTQPNADRLWGFVEIGEEFFRCELGEFGLIGEELIGVRDVGLVMLIVVDPHCLGIDVRLKGLVSVGQRRECVGTGRWRLGFSRQGCADKCGKARENKIAPQGRERFGFHIGRKLNHEKSDAIRKTHHAIPSKGVCGCC